MKTCRFFFLLVLTMVAIPGVPAADKIPKEMKPKLVRDGKVLIEEKFDGTELAKAWMIPAGEFAGTVKIEGGQAMIESGAGRQGAIWQKLEPAAGDASIQLLMKPVSSTWMGVRFMNSNEPGARNWKLATIIYANGYVRVATPDTDGAGLKVLKSAKTEIKPGEWWRVSVECKGKKYLVRVNGEEMIELDDPQAALPKTSVLVNLYGGKGVADEIVVTASAR